MVKENTHLFAAERILHLIKAADIRKLIERNRKSYHLGATIPDAFFYSYNNNIKKISGILHGKQGNLTNDFIFQALDNARKSRNLPDLAFIMGYLSHCALDITFHPVIYYYTGNHRDGSIDIRKATYLHWHYETYLDAKWNDRFYIENLIDASLIDRLHFFDIISNSMNVPKEGIIRAVKNQKFLNKLFRSGLVYQLVRFAKFLHLTDETPMGIFYGNLDREKIKLDQELVYRDTVSGDGKKTTLDSLLDEACSLGERMIRSAYDYYTGAIERKQCLRVISGKSLATGKLKIPVREIRFTRFSGIDPL
ncbi:MAG: zinc dependent phospholipase C family protein [Candidatus Thermoplasmatota archaeon]|nr:zinc dependent phospholipase C family protein [Candidatus Thermoplasmatota archaeon]